MEIKIRKILPLFCIDLMAVQVAGLADVSVGRGAVNKILQLINNTLRFTNYRKKKF